MKQQIIEVLSSVRTDINYLEEMNLINGNHLDSLDIISIVTALEETFNVEIEIDEIIPENFNSYETIMKLISTKVGA